MIIVLVSPIVLAMFGDTKMIHERTNTREDDIDSYRDVFMKYILSNFVL